MEAPTYFQQWYLLNGHAVQARRQHKYRTDPAYRARILAANKVRYNKAQRHYKTTFQGQIVWAFTISEAASMIGKTPSTIRQWESTGLIPPSIFPTRRLYTPHQVNLLRDIAVILALSGARHTDNGKIQGQLAALKNKIYDQWNEMKGDK